MNFIITIFIVSFCALSMLIALKMYEVRRERKLRVLEVLNRFDYPLQRHFARFHAICYEGYDRVVCLVREDIPTYSRDLFVVLRQKATDKYRSIAPNIRGIRRFRSNREASRFLQDIGNHREKNGRGSIDSF